MSFLYINWAYPEINITQYRRPPTKMLILIVTFISYIYVYSASYNTVYFIYIIVPGAPTNLMISPPSGSCDQLMVTWTAPSNTGGLPVKYTVYGNDTLIHLMLNATTTTTTTLNELTADTQYTVRVVAFNDLGDGGEVTGTGRTRPEGIHITY